MPGDSKTNSVRQRQDLVQEPSVEDVEVARAHLVWGKRRGGQRTRGSNSVIGRACGRAGRGCARGFVSGSMCAACVGFFGLFSCASSACAWVMCGCSAVHVRVCGTSSVALSTRPCSSISPNRPSASAALVKGLGRTRWITACGIRVVAVPFTVALPRHGGRARLRLWFLAGKRRRKSGSGRQQAAA